MLVVAGSLLRAQAGQVEADVLFRALRDFNIPKILAQDLVIFTGLLQDLFPGTSPPRQRDLAFEQVLTLLQCPAGPANCCMAAKVPSSLSWYLKTSLRPAGNSAASRHLTMGAGVAFHCSMFL